MTSTGTRTLPPLSTAVRSRRTALGLTQVAVAMGAGLTSQTIKNVETGVFQRPKAVTLGGLDRALAWDPGTALRILNGAADEAAWNQRGASASRLSELELVTCLLAHLSGRDLDEVEAEMVRALTAGLPGLRARP